MSEEPTKMAARGTVVLTGSSSGIGAACARLLAGEGYKVFAGHRDVAEVGATERVGAGTIVYIPLDVTDDTGVFMARAEVERRLGPDGRLDGLINNAGITVIGPTELLDLDDMREQFEVNLLGAARVSREFLPLLRRSGGRIVNIGSLTARMTFPFSGPYAASKSALATMSHAMRRELRPHGVHVSLLEPGNIRTGIWDKHIQSVEALLEKAEPEVRRVYEQDLRADIEMVGKLRSGGGDPNTVARTVLHALSSEKPKSRYAVGLDAKALTALLRFLPSLVSDRLIAKFMGHR